MDEIVYEKSGTFSKVTVVEKPPCIRTLAICGCCADKISGEPRSSVLVPHHPYPVKYYRLAIPWQIYIIQTSTPYPAWVKMGFRNEPLTQNDQELFCPNLWNMNANLCLCLGTSDCDFEDTNKTIEAIWSSIWTNEYIMNANYKNFYSHDGRVSHWSEWAKNAKENPNFITTVKWELFGHLDQTITCVFAR